MSEMQAGRELDALIHSRVMGVAWDESRCRVCGWPLRPTTAEGCVADNCALRPRPMRRADDPPHYSTNIALAWRVAESRPLGAWNWRMSQCDDGRRFAEVRLGYETSYSQAFPVWAATAPLAICRAALSALPARTDPTQET